VAKERAYRHTATHYAYSCSVDWLGAVMAECLSNHGWGEETLSAGGSLSCTYAKMLGPAREAATAIICEKMRVFGSNGMA